MDITKVFQYFNNIALPIAILIIFVAIIYNLLKSEKKEHHKTRTQLDSIQSRLEERLYHELDELEKLLREERVK